MSRHKILGLSLWGLLFALSIAWFAHASRDQVSIGGALAPRSRVAQAGSGINDVVIVTEKARRLVEQETVQTEESRTLIQSLEKAVRREQSEFDAIREQTLRKTKELQDLRERINQSITDGVSKTKVEDLNLRFEAEARELQDLQLEMNEAYVKLQGLQEQAIADLLQHSP